MKWYEKYLSIYEKPFSEVSQNIIDETRSRLAVLQNDEPLVSIVIVAYNEECRLPACLWSLSEQQCKYPVEFIGVDNESKDRTAEIYVSSVLPITQSTSIPVAMPASVASIEPKANMPCVSTATQCILLTT